MEKKTSFESSQEVISYLQQGNDQFVNNIINTGDVSQEKRTSTAQNGQHPYATIVTCSDSRVPAEHIFNAGIGELFVIRTAGNVIGDHELGSIEYGAEHLNTKLVVVLGHTQCGAVDAALNSENHGYIKTITDKILSCVPQNCDPREAEKLNVQNSINDILKSDIMTELVNTDKTRVVGAIYDIQTGKVSFME
ncbi:MAG: carbonic anhydrase [Clostridia bacterium]|nr:carbonic anhydrase [Clostridia bacterium]